MLSEFPPRLDHTEKIYSETEKKERATAKLMTVADALMIAHHGAPTDENRKPFHNIDHPHKMLERAERLAAIFELTPHQKTLVNVAIAYHDVDINVELPPHDNIVGMLKRARGAKDSDVSHGAQGNEALSADRAAEAMRQANTDAQSDVFSETDIETVIAAIHATYPAAEFGKAFRSESLDRLQTANTPIERAHVEDALSQLADAQVTNGINFYQPHLEVPLEKGETVPLETLVVALTDMAHPGAEKPQQFEQQGDAEFRELLPNIALNLSRLVSGKTEQDTTDRNAAAGKMLGWLKDQRGFIMWQMLRLEKLILLLRQNGQLTPDKEQALRNFFSHFSENITKSIEREKEVSSEYNLLNSNNEKAAFVYLAKQLGYKIEPMGI